MTVELPNIRKLFVPDPGYIIFDCDLSGADAQVVAWEAQDSDLKKAFRSGMKIHEKNARDIFEKEYDMAAGDRSNKGTPKGKMYDSCKRSVHLTNYGGSPRTMHLTPEIAWPILRCETFQKKWFYLHPGIREWHKRTGLNLQLHRKAENAFGYRILYFDRIDGLLPQALAWIPQSTVALVTFKGAIQLCRECPWVEMLLQVHDSLVFQVPFHRAESYSQIMKGLRVEVPYPDPLVIPWGVAVSDKSWGDCSEPPGVDFKALQGIGPSGPSTQ